MEVTSSNGALSGLSYVSYNRGLLMSATTLVIFLGARCVVNLVLWQAQPFLEKLLVHISNIIKLINLQ